MDKKPYRVVGLDLSLTSTGVSDGQNHYAIQTGPEMAVEQRLNHVARDAVSRAVWDPLWFATADLVVIEAGAFSRGAQSEAAEWLAALRYMVRTDLWVRRIPFAMVAPTRLKKFTTGHGNANKGEMVAMICERWGVDFGTVKVKDGRYDQADAFALAQMGYAFLGDPFAPEPVDLAVIHHPHAPIAWKKD